MHSLAVRWVVPVALVGLLAGACARSSNGQAPVTGSAGSTTTDVRGLESKVRDGIVGIRTARFTYVIDNAGQRGVITGDGTYRDGRVTAATLSDPLSPTENVRIVIVGRSIYVRLPASVNHHNKPWVLATPQSNDPLMRGLSSMTSARDATSLSSVLDQLPAATSVRADGAATLNGEPMTKYTLVIDVAKLPLNADNAPLIESGLTTYPMEMWIDAQSRPIQVHTSYSVQGQHFDFRLSYGNFNAPVTITAPPRQDIASD